MAAMVCGVGGGPAGILARVSYAVQTDVFEGPFDLLLHLIVRDQVDLYEVSLVTIVDAYLVELGKLQKDGLDLDVATEFLLIAATLVELKARRLLPGVDDVDVDEEIALWDERDVLLARLLECKTFKDAAVELLAGDPAARRTTRRVLRLLWRPVGAKAMPAGETRHLVTTLFGGRDGEAVAARVDRRIDLLPGLAGLGLVRGALDRYAA